MEGKLMELATGELLKKFGAGNHKPGSGSASAFQGLLAAQMLKTVIDLTAEPKRTATYAKSLPELLRIKVEIESRIYPELELLFQQDSDEFDKVIKLRDRRDAEQDLLKKAKLSIEAKDLLKVATEIPLKIADLCLELGNHAAYVFDHGFRSARGDSAVAINCAASATGSCLSIVELNLSTLPADTWMEEIRKQKLEVRYQYNLLSALAINKLEILEKESEENNVFHKSIGIFQAGNLADRIRSNADIERITRELQNTLWKFRGRLWKQNTPEISIEVLDPEVALKRIMGYEFIEQESLGVHEIGGEWFETAGVINKSEKFVQISKRFPKDSQLFTAAHELGHSILHKELLLHRDRSVDGSSNTAKSLSEMQADKFAAYFLMPAKSVVGIFQEVFETSKFVINEGSVLALREGNIQLLRSKAKNIHGLARILASAEYYAGKPLNSLASVFGVSITTMAIRLEELDLLEF